MADVKSIEGADFPEKRKLDLPNSVSKSLEEDNGTDDSKKRVKFEIPSGENGSLSHPAGENVAKSDELPSVKSLEEGKGSDDCNKRPKFEISSGENGSADNVAKSDEQASAEEDDDEDDEEDYNAEQDDDEDVSGEAEIVDIKGKGIMRDDKGKGKMIEDSDDDDSDGLDVNDDDSSDDSDSDFSDGLDESDLEDDPLAEVDLDNILPSRTRQRRVQRGVIIDDSDKGVGHTGEQIF